MLILPVLIAATIHCAAPTNAELVGLWESEQVSKGGIGHTLEFKADGSYIEAMTVIVDMLYRFDNGKLAVFEPQATPDRIKGSGVDITFTDNGHILKGPDGSSVRKERLGKVHAKEIAPIVGVWRYRHYTGGMAFERYTPEGVMQFRLPMSSSTGCYNMEKNHLNIIQNNIKTIMPFKLNGDQLALENESKPPSRYRRDYAGGWYPRDTIENAPQQKRKGTRE